jgi:Carboxypeptidase regulatory-like domain/TonB dependent receptor-like, beta-barrel
VVVPIRRVLSRSLLAAGIVLTIGFAAAPAKAQILYGSVVGVVRDGTGAFIPGATVTVVNKDTNLTREATTNNEGAYSLINVLPGPYDVKVSLTGFRNISRPNVDVTIGQIARVDFTLELGAVQENVLVVAESPILQTDKTDIHTQLKSEVITQLPLNRFRNFQALLNLAPGTTPMAFGNAETDTPGRSMATNVNGQANTQNSTRTDGATNMNIWLPNHLMYVSPVETVDTVDVSTSSFDAEQGMAGGAAVTVITKSGTNQFRGSAFEGFNNQGLNATPAFFGVGAAPPKLPVKGNGYGGTVGGPIKKNKLFFFGSFEGYKRRSSLFTYFTVPDDALRSGDFSKAFNTNGSVQTIFNPFTGNADGTGRQAFPNNQIPANMLNPIAMKILQLFPKPNFTGIGAGGYTNNYQRQEDRKVDRQNYDGKVNWNRTSAHQIWAKFSHMHAVVDDLSNYLGVPTVSGSGGNTKVYQLTAGQTWTLTPTLLMDQTFGFSRQKQDVLGPDFNAGNFGRDVLGIPGTNDQGSGDQRYAGYPEFRFGGTTSGFFSQLGNRDGWNPIFRDERTYSIATNITKVHGQHDFRGGYFLNFLYLDHWQPETGNPRGQFIFNNNTTGLRGGSQTPNFYNAFAAFLLGQVGQANKSVQNELMTSREWQHALYFRDRWTPTAKLTLDLGLRWEFYPIMHRADGRGLDRLDLTNPVLARQLDVLVAGRGDNPQNNGMKAGLDNFAPRVGAAYRINEDTVVRTGYGITYNAQAWARAVRGDNDYPVTIASTFLNAESYAAYAPLEAGIPRIVGPDLSSGRVPLDRAAAEYTPEIDNIDRGYIHTWNVAFQRRIVGDVTVDVAYVGAKGVGGYAGLDINAPLTLGGGDASRPYASLGRLVAINSWGERLKTRYNSLQVAFNKPFTHGFLLKGAYTLAKAMNESDNDGRATLLFNTPSQLDRNWAAAGFDRRHNLQVGFVYALPWQRGSGYGNPLKALASDWQINGMFAAFSGNPFTVTGDNGASINTPSNQQTADLAGSYTITDKIGASGAWFDTTQFKQPTGVRFGNTGRNQFYGPGGNSLDLSVFRVFPLGGTRRLEARVEAGNIFNNNVYANPQNSVTSGTFGQITGIAGGTALTNAAYVERSVRLGIRFSF